MASKNEIKLVRSLSQKKFRDESGLFVVEGEKLVREACESGFEVVSIFRTEDIGEDAMARMTLLSSPSPVLALVRKMETPALEDLQPGLILALDSVRDPGNLGTIVRIADWFGIKDILVSEDTVDIYNPKVVQATMGAVFRVRVIPCRLPEALHKASARLGLPVYGTYLDGEDIYASRLTSDGIIVMGSESNGISKEVGLEVDRKLHIPSFALGRATSESLNVAVATAVTCSEFRRRKLIG